MGCDELFEGLPEMPAPQRQGGGAPRLREPVRDQLELRSVDLDSLIAADHRVRAVWAYVARLDLGVLEDRIKAREGRPGHPPASPHLLLALWLYGTSEGVGSARALEALCTSHDAYRWLCGGVGVNYHTLADFRGAHPALLDELLAQSVASLAAAGAIDLDTLAQDGVRVRASAGAGSFRRRRSLHKCLKQARRRVALLKAELEAERARRARTNASQTRKQKEPRASTTDPEARVMKMADGGFRPAYNLQIVSTPESQIIVAVELESSGSDRGQMRAMLERLKQRYRSPRRYLADGGFTKNADIEWAAEPANGAIALYCPPPKSRHKTDPFAPRPKDGPGMAAWRQRMKSAAGKLVYRRRAIAECIHARLRHWGLVRFTVRGKIKGRTVALWHALANNILRATPLLAQARA